MHACLTTCFKISYKLTGLVNIRWCRAIEFLMLPPLLCSGIASTPGADCAVVDFCKCQTLAWKWCIIYSVTVLEVHHLFCDCIGSASSILWLCREVTCVHVDLLGMNKLEKSLSNSHFSPTIGVVTWKIVFKNSKNTESERTSYT